MLEDAILFKLMKELCSIFLHVSKYGDQTHCENLDCVGQLEIGQAGYLLNHPRKIKCDDAQNIIAFFMAKVCPLMPKIQLESKRSWNITLDSCLILFKHIQYIQE